MRTRQWNSNIWAVWAVSVLALAGCSKDSGGTSSGSAAAKVDLGGSESLGGITVKVPDDWDKQEVTSPMRRGQWKVNGTDGEAELVVFHFGQRGAGSVEANLNRWYKQFTQPDERPTKEVAVSETKTIADMKVTRVEVGGRYVARLTPTASARHNIPDARMLAAIVEAADGAYYFKMVGPKTTIEAATPGFDAMLGSLTKNAAADSAGKK